MASAETSNNKWKIQLHYFLALILVVHSIFFLVYWFSVGSFREDVDQFITNTIDWDLPYTNILVVMTGLIALWSVMRFARMQFALRKGDWKPSFFNWFYIVVWVLFLVLFYLAFTIILRENPSQRGVLLHLLNLSRVGGDGLVFLLAGIWLRRFILHLRRRMEFADNRWLYMVGIIFVLVSLVGLWLLPALYPPNWAYQGDLPAKPALLAHRGASMLAPENTLAAVDLAAENEAFGFETDVRISQDGIPFLMHDETLERTTNIAEVFPERVRDNASSFTMDELKKLNAGLWFIQKDPFGTIAAGLVSQTQLGINQGQKIPTLSEALIAVKGQGLAILFDMRFPPPDHPYYEDFFDIVLSKCQESGLNQDVWFLVDSQHILTVKEEAPQLTRVVGAAGNDLPAPEMLLKLGYEIINVDTGIPARAIQAYRQEGLGVNVYTIDQPWLFSQFWLSGVTSVTTNNIHSFSQIESPSLDIPYSRYLLFWGLFGIIVAIWLAGSQPEPLDNRPTTMKTPDLMDFADEDAREEPAQVPVLSPQVPQESKEETPSEEEPEE